MDGAFNFDKPVSRRSQPGDKWDRYRGRDVLPLWVADMDFEAPEAVIDALRARVDHGVFGYTSAWPGLVEAVIEGLWRDHDWRIEPDWLVWLPGVVTGLNLACRLADGAHSGVFTATPVYPPFLAAPGNNGQRLLTAPLVDRGHRWEWDRDAVAATITPDTGVFMLCNPHNPVGRVFDREELRWIADLAERHDLLICADEIHCGLILDDERPHIPIAALDEATAARTITLMAPSKTWNVPGLYCAFAIIPDAGLRRRFKGGMRGMVPPPNLLGMVAAEGAYRHGDAWRRALLDYLRHNRERVMTAISAIPALRTTRPEATYLAWIDCRDAGLEDNVAFFEQAGVGLSDGEPFGMPGYVRLNFGCPRATLDEALARIGGAFAR